MDPAEIGDALGSSLGVANVHDLHVWEVTSEFPALSAHVLVEPENDCHEKRRELEHLLAERFDIHHTTLQVDHATPEVIGLSEKEDFEDGIGGKPDHSRSQGLEP